MIGSGSVALHSGLELRIRLRNDLHIRVLLQFPDHLHCEPAAELTRPSHGIERFGQDQLRRHDRDGSQMFRDGYCPLIQRILGPPKCDPVARVREDRGHTSSSLGRP